jgi:hypothetical protein
LHQLIIEIKGQMTMQSALPQHQVKTPSPNKEESKARRLPHERDESDDSQTSGPREDMKQAYDDLKNGQVDTDLRGMRGVDEAVTKTSQQIPNKMTKKPDGTP